MEELLLDTDNKSVNEKKLYTTLEIAEELGISSDERLNNILEHKKIQFRKNGKWILNEKYVDKNYVFINQCDCNHGIIIYDRRWTEEGRLFIHSIFD